MNIAADLNVQNSCKYYYSLYNIIADSNKI